LTDLLVIITIGLSRLNTDLIANKTLSESPFITFVRGITLLAFLTVLPGIAVCWNYLPKDIWSESVSDSVTPNIETTQVAQNVQNDSGESALSLSASTPASINTILPTTESQTAIAIPTAEIPQQQIAPVQERVAQQASLAPPPMGTPQDYEALKQCLEALGAKSYRLEKWGDRGELFRFSCLVAPSEPYTYEKQFQSIGSDVVTVIQTVMTEIEQWKGSSSHIR